MKTTKGENMKALLIVMIMLAVTPQAYSGNLPLPEGLKKHTVEYTSVCIGGYLFAMAYSRYGIELKQVYKSARSGFSKVPQPIRCND